MATTQQNPLTAPAEAVCEPVEEQAATANKGSYGQILKSSALVGGSQIFNVAIGIVRTKAMALLLGPGGFGLAGLYNSISDITQNLAGMGVNSSGVRQIAEAVGSGNTDRITLTIAVLRRTSVALGAIGALALVIFCGPISRLTFGSDKYAAGVALISVAAFFKLVSGGQGALIQGMRRIRDLAKMTVFGALLGAATGVLLIYFFRQNGIVPYLIVVAAMSAAMSWWYSRKVRVPKVSVHLSEITAEVSALLKLGFAFMISSLVALGVAYAIRVFVLHKVGIEGTGLYQSAWTIGGMYVSFILQAMGADFYPRLTANIHDHAACNRLVNEQAQVGLLLAGPGVIATLTFAPLVIATLYSTKFAGSVPILRWICLGAALQVITWPMGYIIVAKGRQNLLIFCEVAWAVASLILAWACINRFGLNGAGIAFFLSYVFHFFLIYPVVGRLSGFRWSRENSETSLFFFAALAIVFAGFHFLGRWTAIALGAVAFTLTTAYALRAFSKIIAVEDVPPLVRRLLRFVGVRRFGFAD
jgi:antigen flippase